LWGELDGELTSLNKIRMTPRPLFFVLFVFGCSLRAEPTVTIGNTSFFLASEEKGKDSRLREFLPLGDELKSWRRLVGIREFYTLEDPKQYVLNLGGAYRAKNPTAKFMVSEDKANGDWLIDFMIGSPDPKNRFIEWNVFRARKVAKGIMVFQFAMRFPFKKEVQEILGEVPKFGGPVSRSVYAETFEVTDTPKPKSEPK